MVVVLVSCEECYLDYETLNEALEYDTNTGKFFWKYRDSQRPQWNARCAGKLAGCTRKADGYLILTINSVQTYGQIAAWLLCGKVIPKYTFVDHIDGDPTNNTIKNLRLVSKAESVYNTKVRVTSNTSNFKGVHKTAGGKFVAQITFNYKCIHLGTYGSELIAAGVYNWAATELQGEYARLNSCKSVKPVENIITKVYNYK